RVTAGLDAAGIVWTRDPRLVRGLDYYRHTAFEFVTEDLGAQNAVIAGGRYDGLMESLGGPHTPAVGWAAGIERLGMLIELPEGAAAAIAIVPDRPELEAEAFALAVRLRRSGISTDLSFRGNAKKRIETARRRNVSAVLILRDDTQQPRLHLTHYRGDGDQRLALANEILGAVRGVYEGISGGGPR
ncbi:MAG: ATP phosphoribosyltransferase regulatory subunit, partial [Allosphingosinicella sp.]